MMMDDDDDEDDEPEKLHESEHEAASPGIPKKETHF